MVSWLVVILFFEVFMDSNYAHYCWLIYRGCAQPCRGGLTQFCFQGQYTLLKIIVPSPLFPYGRVSLSVIALKWSGSLLDLCWAIAYYQVSVLKLLPQTHQLPIALRLVYNIFSTSELNVIIFITTVDAIVIQVQKYLISPLSESSPVDLH